MTNVEFTQKYIDNLEMQIEHDKKSKEVLKGTDLLKHFEEISEDRNFKYLQLLNIIKELKAMEIIIKKKLMSISMEVFEGEESYYVCCDDEYYNIPITREEYLLFQELGFPYYEFFYKR